MKQYFISGILVYLIFNFSYRLLSSLTNIVLIYFNVEKLVYVGLLFFSAILSLLLLKRLFYYIKKGQNKITIYKLVGFLITVFLLYSGANRFIGFLAENNKVVNFNKVEYLSYPDFAIILTTIIGIIFLWYTEDSTS